MDNKSAACVIEKMGIVFVASFLLSVSCEKNSQEIELICFKKRIFKKFNISKNIFFQENLKIKFYNFSKLKKLVLLKFLRFIILKFLQK